MKVQSYRFHFSRKLLVFSSVLSAFLFAFSVQTFAVDFTVNLITDQHDANLGDGVCDIDLATVGEQCSLRAAVEQANSLGSNDRVFFNLPANSTITLTTDNGGEITMSNSGTLEIVGTGANNLTINGGAGTNRIFYTLATATISGITLTGGDGTGALDSSNGGAINAAGGSLTLDRVYVTGNTTAPRTPTPGLQPPIVGGGVYFGDGTHRIINSTFSANTSFECAGFANFAALTVVNSTISGNSSGGGFCNIRGTTTLRNVTITGNTANGGGGGIFQLAGALNFGNTIVAGNSTAGGSAPEILFLGGTITSAGGNLVGDSAGDSTNTTVPSFPNAPRINYQLTDKRDINPLLGALAYNGGETPTHALLTGSPLIDAGLNDVAVDPSSFIAALAFDQRGAPFARIRDGNGDGSAIVDIGAFERSNARGTRPTAGDFDGDGNADIAVFRRSNGFWYVMNSSGGFSGVQWGFGTDTPVPGDYDGDGKTDLAVYRRGPSSDVYGNINDNAWHIRRSSDNTFLTRQYGKSGAYVWDVPVPADYDGDGKTDLGLYELSDGIGGAGDFKVWQSSDGARYERRWGSNIDRIVPRDYDGDGKADLATVRIEPRFSSNGIAIWQILQSSDGVTRQVQFGLATDVTVPRDYDGDGKADIAVYRPSNGVWYRLNSGDGSFFATQFGLSTDIAVPADYDGDGKIDIAVFRPSNGTWYLQQSKDGFAAYVFGLPDDVPVTALAR